jgi:hypothetical protein
VKWEEITETSDTNAEDILQKVLKRLENTTFYTVKSSNMDYVINTSSIRYVRIFEKSMNMIGDLT